MSSQRRFFRMRNALHGVEALAFPGGCATCGAELLPGDVTMCWECAYALRSIGPPFCACCGQPTAGDVDIGLTDYTCQQCDEFPPAFDIARSYARFEGPARSAILRLKYQRELWLVPTLANWLNAVAITTPEISAAERVIPVPLHPQRQRERGFNQSALVAHPLAKHLGIRFLANGLQRTRPTPTQTRLSKPARRENVRGAFKVRRPEEVKGARILIVDDVMTSGATVSECARVLKKVGATHVTVATLAHG